MPGVIIAAPGSGSGKTTVTLGLLRAFRRRGTAVRGAKSGPDYIDPRFHEAACGQPCVNLDPWAMSPQRLRALAATDDLLLIEGAMGLFDGVPPDGRGATADLARVLGLPVVLVVDAARMAQSVAPLVAGFARHAPAVRVAGVILNRVGRPSHAAILRRALATQDIPVLGALPRQSGLTHPSRHLGLVQAGERDDLDAYIDTVATTIAAHVDLAALGRLATSLPAAPPHRRFDPPGQRLAVASDTAFAFAYPHLLRDWQDAGAEIFPFSPLADDPVPHDVDVVILPGGYPELHAGRIAAVQKFINSLRIASQHSDIYGECGGYMVLGNTLTDASGKSHNMAGLLPLATSFADRQLHLGYRRLTPLGGIFSGPLLGHEFHYASTLSADGAPLFAAHDAAGARLPDMGLRRGRVCGSFAHVIDRAE